MQKFSSKKNRPKFDIEWMCSKTFNLSVLSGTPNRRQQTKVFCYFVTTFLPFFETFRWLLFQLPNQTFKTVGGRVVKGYVGFPTNDNSASQALYFDWPDATEANRNLSERCHKVVTKKN